MFTGSKMYKGLLGGKFLFKRLLDGSLEKSIVICVYCGAEFKYHRSSTSLSYHLRAKHPHVPSANHRQASLLDIGVHGRIINHIPETITPKTGALKNDRDWSPFTQSDRPSENKRKRMSDSSSSGEEEPSESLAPIEDSDLDEKADVPAWHRGFRVKVENSPTSSKGQELTTQAGADQDPIHSVGPELARGASTSDESRILPPAPYNTVAAQVAPWPDQECGFDAAVFWRQIHTAGCTEAIFADFLNDMKDVSLRIQREMASREDYEVALKVMMASGKITHLLGKQQKELEQKQMAVQKSLAAMQDVVSLLRR